MDPTVTAAYVGAAGGVIGGVAGGAVGGWLALRAAKKSLEEAARQAQVAHEAERTEERRGALLALAWELEINQERLQEAIRAKLRPPLLDLHALQAAAPWCALVPEAPCIREVQVAMVRFNAETERWRAEGVAEGFRVDGLGEPILRAIAAARGVLDKELSST